MLSADVKGYYPNMLHSVAEAEFERHLPEWAYLMVVDVLRGQYPGDVGYNPGSQIVQIAGVSVLNRLDHVCKERLGCRLYGRYMDDTRIISHDREYLEAVMIVMADELAAIGFELHPRKTLIRPLTERNTFLGFDFRLTDTGKVVITLCPESAKRMRRRVSRLMALEARGLRPPGTTEDAYMGWRAHAAKGDSRLLLERCDKWFCSIGGVIPEKAHVPTPDVMAPENEWWMFM
jgi:hypothetical protein